MSLKAVYAGLKKFKVGMCEAIMADKISSCC